jgi:hypothetical protein
MWNEKRFGWEGNMKNVFGLIRIMVYMFFLMCILASSAFAEDFYIAQNSAGGDTGANCSNAHSVAWFNTSGNWGAGAGKITAGDTVHLCGTFSATNNASPMLTFQASGSAGSPITVVFETGAKLEAYYWGASGAISMNAKSYITIDGGTTCGQVDRVKTACNGLIRNTKAGSSGLTCPDGNACAYVLGNTTNSSLISNSGTFSGIEIKNLHIGPAYTRRLNTNAEGMSTTAVMMYSGTPNGVSIHNNIIEGSGKNILIGNGGSSSLGHLGGYQIYNNDISNMCWGIGIGFGGATGTYVDNIQIHHNEIYDWRWAGDNFGANVCHANGMMMFIGWGDYSPSYIGDNTSNVYSNYLHGSLSGDIPSTSASGFISGQDNYGPVNEFNNIVIDNATLYNGGSAAIYHQAQGSGGQKIYNNTVVRAAGNCINAGNYREADFGKPIIRNNICKTTGFLQTYNATPGGFITDYNIYTGDTSAYVMYNLGSGYNAVSLSSWKSTYGQEMHGITSNPNLDGNYKPQASSPVIGAGVNLTSLGIAPLNYDRAGVARPSSGAWSIGAYEYISGASVPKTPVYPGFINVSP